MPMNPGTKLASSAAMRKSQTQASESPAPAHDAVHRGDHGLLERADREHVRVIRRAQRVADVARLAELRQVLAGARSRGRRR